jgi:hypothetical protein
VFEKQEVPEKEEITAEYTYRIPYYLEKAAF